jgi:hypothetical protein
MLILVPYRSFGNNLQAIDFYVHHEGAPADDHIGGDFHVLNEHYTGVVSMVPYEWCSNIELGRPKMIWTGKYADIDAVTMVFPVSDVEGRSEYWHSFTTVQAKIGQQKVNPLLARGINTAVEMLQRGIASF